MKRHNVVFLSDLPREREAKIARAMRAHGIPSMLVYVNRPNHYNPEDYFDFAIQASHATEAVAIVHRLHPDIVHLFSYGADPTAIAMMRNKTGKVVYDYKDCFENMLRHTLPAWAVEGQRFLVENADGLCCRDLQLAKYCQLNGIRPAGKRMLFVDYCWGERNNRVVPRDDDEIHIAMAGNFNVEKIEPWAADNGYLHTSRELVRRGMHVHIYPHSHYRKLDADHLSDYVDLARTSPLFHVHAPVGMKDFVNELSQYDYGMIVVQGTLFPQIGVHTTLNGAMSHIAPTRWFDYLEAGLETLISPQLHFSYRQARNAHVGVAATAEIFEQQDMRRVLRNRINWHKDARINAARAKYDIKRHLPKLIDFYESL